MSLHTVSDPTLARVPTSAETAILLENVSVRYRVPHERVATLKEHAIKLLQRRLQYDDFYALHGVDLQVCRGQVVGIIGHNGAGKSTLLKVIARVLRPTQGRVVIAGRVAPLLEFGAGFHPELTGRENIFLNGALFGFTQREMQAKFNGIVEFAELWDYIDAPLRTYSSGMIARLGFAVATDVDPAVLIVDEVLAVGDAAFQRKSIERIQSFRAAGTTILLVSHTLEAVQMLCDRAIWMDHGRIVADDSAESVIRQYRDRVESAESKRLAAAAGPAENQRWGSRDIEITGVHLMDGRGGERTIFGTGDTLVLQIDYRASRPIPSPVFGMAVHRQDGAHISGPNTSFAGITLPTVEATGRVIYTVPYLPLLEGLYLISVAVTNREDTDIFDYHDRCYPFRVLNDHVPLKEKYGLVTLRGTWQHASGDTVRWT